MDHPATSPGARILVALTLLIAPPFLLYNCLPAPTVIGNILIIKNVWDALLRVSCGPVALCVLLSAIYFGPCLLTKCTKCPCNHDNDSTSKACVNTNRLSLRFATWTGASPEATKVFFRRVKALFMTLEGLGMLTALALFLPWSICCSMPAAMPSWGWVPMAWFSYRLYPSAELASSLEGLCLNQDIHTFRLVRRSSSSFFSGLFSFNTGIDDRSHLPLCLTEDSWKFLSSGSLSSTKANDVRSVLKGVQFAQDPSHGLAIAVLARDVVDTLPSFRENVESLSHFFPRLSVVVFENDSRDGSREALRQWVDEVEVTNRRYQVDLMECEEAKDCKFGKKHRDHDDDEKNAFATSKAVGDMDIYRQRVADYITESPYYADFSHMLVLDLDLGVSISPLGLLHSLGEHPENAVASSGRQLLSGAWGTLDTPYDASAFRPWATETNHWILMLHERWCSIMPPGQRWRNACDATSPFLLFEILRMDRGTSDSGDFYRVESAFNGLVVYPLDLVRESKATYDAGEDGQRCEHIGFNLALKKPMYVNRRWDMHLDPENPGGPTGWRAKNIIDYVTGTPRIFFWLLFVSISSYWAFVHSITTLGVYLVYPLMAPLLVGSQSIRRMLSSHHRKRRRIWATNEETLFKIV
jgi:hypothetical protein